MRTIRFIAALLPVCLFAAGEGRLTGPVSALHFDAAAHSVRAVIGIPGAAYVGSAVATEVDAARLSPDGKILAIVRGGSLQLMRESAEGWSTATVAADLPSPLTLTWSTDSAEISAITASGALLTWKTDASPIAARAIPAAASAVAISPAGAVAASAEGIYLAGAASARLIAPADNAVAVAVNGSAVYFCDRARGEVKAIADINAPDGAVLAAKLEAPVGVAVDAARKLLLVATESKVIGLRLGTYEPVFELPLDFTPSSLESFGTAGWLLNAGQSGPLQVLSLDEAPAVFFVPNEGRN